MSFVFAIIKQHHGPLFQVMESKRGKQCFAKHVRGTYFERSKDVEVLIEQTEKFVTNTLEKGDRNKAMQKLRVPPLSGLELVRSFSLANSSNSLVTTTAHNSLETCTEYILTFPLRKSTLLRLPPVS